MQKVCNFYHCTYFVTEEANLANAVFLSCFPRLLVYECNQQTHEAVPYAYQVMWQLVSFNKHQNVAQEILATRTQDTKLSNLVHSLVIVNNITD